MKYNALFFLLIITSCIPVRIPKSIPNYKLKTHKVKLVNKKQKFTEYVFEIDAKDVNFSNFLKQKFNSSSCKITDLCYRRITNDTIEQQLVFREFTKNVNVINLLPMFYKNEPSFQKIDYKKYIGVIVKDDFNYDYLSDKSPYKKEIIKYLSQLKSEYLVYIQ